MSTMQAACWAANVTACSSCAATSTSAEPPKAAVSTKRSTDSAAAHSSQPCASSRPKTRPWNQKNAISTTTATAHRPPTADFG